MLPLVVSVAHLKLLSHVTQEKITLSLLEYHSPLLSSLYSLVGFPGYQQQHILRHLQFSQKIWLHVIAHNLCPDCSCLIMRINSESPLKDKLHETCPISLGHCKGSERID